ncbi:MAG: metallophosphoesterase [Planctomycetaceae bacterium]|nr:metallophosphoesterase [Planctomycetaceae bacterium]
MQRRRFLQCVATGASVAGVAAACPPIIKAEPTRSETDRSRVVRFAHLTDIHLYAKRSAAIGLAKALAHVQSLDDPPDFLINGGDAIYDALEVDFDSLKEQWTLWKSVWAAENSLPVRHCLGNHDIWGWDREKSKTTGKEAGWGKAYSLEQLGLENSYYAFEQHGWKIVILDSMTADDETVYRGDLGEEQFNWLKDVLTSTPVETPVVVVSHIPILTVGDVGWSRELAQQPQAHRMLRHQDRGELLQLFRQHPNVILCLSGHTHLTEQIEIAGLSFINSGAVSGLWWKGNNAHTDEGYRIIDLFDDGSFETEYVSYGWEVER